MQRPNILMIVADQQRRDTIGAYGSAIVRTPAIDRLAGEGMTFDNAFTPCGLCSPTRASMLTGVYPHKHEVLTNIQFHPVRNQLQPEADILASGLAEQGYRLGYVGKWHVNLEKDPTAFGFEQYVSPKDYATYRRQLRIAEPPEARNYVQLVTATDPIPSEQALPAFLTDHALRMMGEFSQETDHPFFIRLDFDGPHPPLVVSEPYASMFDPASISPFPNYDDPLENKPAIQRIKRKHWKTESMDWSDWQPLVAAYFGMVAQIDDQVARVLDELERLRGEPTLLPTAIEELLRYDGPVQATIRVAREDLEIDGHHLEEGSLVLVGIGAANHDPAVFREPERLDVGRDPNPHLAFGFGAHFCMGAPLARLEAEIAFRVLLERFPHMALATEAPEFR
ncbi:MAG: cytochrome P450, partial [Caldilineaceae bacterium]|nr:cytochrome P450 [Caldilineaceae bacterium]